MRQSLCNSAHWRQPRRGCRGHIPQYFGWGRQREYPPILLRTFGYSRPILVPSVRSASSRFHSAIRRHQFASVSQADSRLTRLVPPNLELALTPLTVRCSSFCSSVCIAIRQSVINRKLKFQSNRTQLQNSVESTIKTNRRYTNSVSYCRSGKRKTGKCLQI